jgi:hypothetical protein
MSLEVTPELNQQFEAFLKGAPVQGGWTHNALLRMVAVAVIGHPGAENDSLCRGIMRLNKSCEWGDYHHTQTVMWLLLVKQWLVRSEPQAWHELDDCFFDGQLALRFYSQRLLDSEAAKLGWVDPDIAPIALPRPLPGDLEPLWREFSLQRISAPNWTHRTHLEAAAAALIGYRAQVAQVMKQGILRLNASHGLVETPDRGYHETLTMAWLHLVCQDLTDSGFWNTAQLKPLSQTLIRKEFIFEYYSPELLKTAQSRYGFVKPDRKVLPPFPDQFFSLG